MRSTLQSTSKVGNQRLSETRRAVVALTRYQREAIKLTQGAWSKYRKWHAEYARRAFTNLRSASRTRKRSTINTLPANVFMQKIAPHLSHKNLLHTFATKPNAFKYVKNARVAQIADEMNKMVRIIVACLQKQHQPLEVVRTARQMAESYRLQIVKDGEKNYQAAMRHVNENNNMFNEFKNANTWLQNDTYAIMEIKGDHVTAMMTYEDVGELSCQLTLNRMRRSGYGEIHMTRTPQGKFYIDVPGQIGAEYWEMFLNVLYSVLGNAKRNVILSDDIISNINSNNNN